MVMYIEIFGEGVVVGEVVVDVVVYDLLDVCVVF